MDISYGSDRFALARFTAGGRLDPTFGNAGRLLTELDWSSADLALQGDGKIVAAGGSDDPALARMLPAGELDSSFGSAGTVVTSLGSRGAIAASAATIQRTYEIVAVGTNNGDFVVARYLPDGSLDPTFGS